MSAAFGDGKYVGVRHHEHLGLAALLILGAEVGRAFSGSPACERDAALALAIHTGLRTLCASLAARGSYVSAHWLEALRSKRVRHQPAQAICEKELSRTSSIARTCAVPKALWRGTSLSTTLMPFWLLFMGGPPFARETGQHTLGAQLRPPVPGM